MEFFCKVPSKDTFPLCRSHEAFVGSVLIRQNQRAEPSKQGITHIPPTSEARGDKGPECFGQEGVHPVEKCIYPSDTRGSEAAQARFLRVDQL